MHKQHVLVTITNFVVGRELFLIGVPGRFCISLFIPPLVVGTFLVFVGITLRHPVLIALYMPFTTYIIYFIIIIYFMHIV